MRSIRSKQLSILALLSTALSGAAQQQTNPTTQIAWPRITVSSGVPAQACTSANYGQPYQVTGVTPNQYGSCGTDGWAIRGGSGTFTPGGDLGGSTSSQQVIGLKTILFCTGFTPTNGQAVTLTTGSSPNPCWTAMTPSGGVATVFGRAGTVLAVGGDYTVSQVTGAAPIASPTFTGTVTIPGVPSAADSFGDSLAQGAGSVLPGDTSSTGVTGAIIGNTGRGYANIIDSAFGVGSKNCGRGSDMSEDMSLKVYSGCDPNLPPPSVANNRVTTMMIGTNNVSICGATTSCQDTYTRSLEHSIAWRGIPDVAKVLMDSTNCTQTGTWIANPNALHSLSSATNGSTMTCSVTTYGTVLYVGYQGVFGQAGTTSVTIDGGSVAAIAYTSNITTANGSNIAFELQRYTGLTAGAHSIVFTVTSSTSAFNTVGLLWVGGPKAAPAGTIAPPAVYVGGVPYQNGDANSTLTAAYNTLSQTATTTLAGDGVNATWVNIRASLNFTTDFTGGFIAPNGTYCEPSPSALITLHFGNCGHRHVAQAFMAAMGVTPLRSDTFGPSMGFAEDVTGYLVGQNRPAMLLNSDPRDGARAGMYYDPTSNVTHIENPGGHIAFDGNGVFTGNTSAPFTFINTSTISGTIGESGIDVLGLGVAADGSQIGIAVGTAKTVLNYGALSFTNLGAGSSSNYLLISQIGAGLIPLPGLCIDGNGHAAFFQSLGMGTCGTTGKALSFFGDTINSGDFQAATVHSGGATSGKAVCTQDGTNCPAAGAGNTQTAGPGGVTINHFVSPDSSAPTKYVASGSGSPGVGVALSTAAASAPFTLSDPVGTWAVCTDANGAIAGHYLTGSALTPSCASDTGQSSRDNISNSVSISGKAQATVSGGANVVVLPDGRGTRGARIDTVSGYIASFARSLDYTAIGTSITNGTGNSNNTTSPNNTNWAGSIGYRTGGTFTNGGISGGEVADILKLAVYQIPYIPQKRAPFLTLEDGTNNANQVPVCGTLAPCLALYSQQHQAAMAFMSIPSDNYNGNTLTLAWSSSTTYLSGDIASSGGLNYIATGGAANLPPNLNKTPASNAGYWAIYVPPVYQKIGAQTSTNITGAFIPDVSLSFSANPNVPQALGEISSSNGASIMLAVPTPAGNPIELVHRIMDGNGGTASVTIDGSAPAANSTISGFASGLTIKTFSQANSDSYALVSYPTTATGAAFVPASSSLTSNVATIVCPATCTTVANQAVTLLGMTNLAFLNGQTLIVQSSSGTSFTVNFTHANVSSAAEATYASVVPSHALQLTVSSTPTDVSITNVAVAANVVTLTATNTLTAGQSIFMHGLATATFLNGVTLTITSRTGTTIVAAGTASGQANGQWTHANYTSAADTGTASVNWIAPSWAGTYPSGSAPAAFESPRVFVLGVIPQSADANSTNTAAFNAQDLADVNTMIAQGAPVTFVDVRNGNGILPGVNPGTDFNDTLHPNDSGHRRMHDLAQAAMQNRENINRMLLLNNGNGGYGGIECQIATCNFGNGTLGDTSYNIAAKNGTFNGPLSGTVQICSSQVSTALTAYTQTASECEIRMTNAAARTVTLASTGPKAGQVVWIKDTAGTAATANITLSVASAGTIDGLASLVIATNSGVVGLRWISSGVWETMQAVPPGTVALTSATGGTGITSVTCATATCTIARGSYTIVGGTATTGTVATLLWPTTTAAWVCTVNENGGAGFLGIGHSVATATGMNITSGVTVVGTTFTVDYSCAP